MYQIVFEITVVVLFAKLMWHSDNEKGIAVFPVPLLSPVKLGKLIAYFIKSLNIMLQSNAENAKYHTTHSGVILFLGSQLTSSLK